jgi:hypothetical protein
MRTHGMTRVGGWKGKISPTYLSWQRMKGRCQNPNAADFARYGGRGISVYARWSESFEDFLADMGERPKGLQLDRIHNDGNYEPGNCRWASKRANARNRSSNVRITLDGVTRTAIEWGELTGLGELVSARISRGWDPERAVRTPRDERYARGRELAIRAQP